MQSLVMIKEETSLRQQLPGKMMLVERKVKKEEKRRKNEKIEGKIYREIQLENVFLKSAHL